MLKQQAIIDFFKQQKIQGKVAHAYLLVGEKDALSLSQYMAMSLTCQHQEKAPCLNCSNCQRILNNQYSDYIYVDGKAQAIKKEDIDHIEQQFSQTSLEQNENKIYVLDGVDQAGHVAMNRLLKFLEEPSDNVTAILIASDENKVLETIKSRCVILSLEKPDVLSLTQTYQDKGIEKLDAYILSHLALSEIEALEYSQDKEFKDLSQAVYDFLDLCNRNDLGRAVIALQSFVQKEKVLTRKTFPYFCDVSAHALMNKEDGDIMKLSEKLNIDHKHHIAKALLDAKSRFSSGINLGLLVDQCAYTLLYKKEQ